MTLSVLMATYKGERPEFLNASLTSIWTQQSRKPDQIIVVKDGPLTPELSHILHQWKNIIGDNLTILAREKNEGLAAALNEGIKHICCELVARMDSDDIAMPDRFEVQEQYFIEHPQTDILGGWIDEFNTDINNIISIRKVPQDHAAIYNYGKTRCPVNHPTIMFRSDVFKKYGTYPTSIFPEDYAFWARLLKNGATFHNIQRSLVWFRFSPDVISRRGGWQYVQREWQLLHYMLNIEYINFGQYIYCLCLRTIIGFSPVWLRNLIYHCTLRHH